MTRPQADWLLESILDLADDLGFSPSITILTHGVLVSGTPISVKEYWRELARQFRPETEQNRPDPPSWQAVFDQIGEDAERQVQEKREQLRQARASLPEGEPIPQDKLDELGRSFIHMENVTILGPGGERTPVRLWRGRLGEVAGWHLGLLER